MRVALGFAIMVLGLGTCVAWPAEAASGQLRLDDIAMAHQTGGPGLILLARSPKLGLSVALAKGRRALDRPQPARPGDAFRTASLTKLVTDALILRLQEEGRLSVADPISKFIAPETLARLQAAGSRPAGDIILAQLMGHTSGLYDYGEDEAFARAVIGQPGRRWTPADLLDAARAGRPYFPPGGGRRYSDTGFVVLGLVAEKASGQSLASAYRTYVLDPLGLSHTYLEGKEPARGGDVVAHAYEGDIDTAGFDPSFDAFGGGGLVSTATDLDRLVRGLFGGALFRRPESLAFMMSAPEVPPGPGAVAAARFGHDFAELDVGDVRCWGHGGHWATFVYYCPSLDLSVSGALNQAQRYDQSKALVAEVIARVAASAAQRAAARQSRPRS